MRRRNFLQLGVVLPVALWSRSQPATLLTARITASAENVNAGDQVTLEWQTRGANSVHVLGWGEVAASGRRSVAITAPTTFVLIASSGDGALFRTVQIAVQGVRGEDTDFEDDLGAFRYPYSCKLSARPVYADVPELLVDCIQSKLKAVQRTFVLSAGRLQIESSRILPRELQTNLPPAYFGRRISYLIEVPGPKEITGQQQIRVTVKSLIEFRRRAEPTWYPERDQSLYQDSSARFERFLASVT